MVSVGLNFLMISKPKVSRVAVIQVLPRQCRNDDERSHSTVAGTPKDLMHGLRHNRDEALPTHSSRLPLLHISAVLGFWKHLGHMRQQVTFKFGISPKTQTGLSTAASSWSLETVGAVGDHRLIRRSK
jgi:hypothetical protein